jgi:hypothetical protein
LTAPVIWFVAALLAKQIKILSFAALKITLLTNKMLSGNSAIFLI